MKKQTKAIIATLTLCLMLPFMMIPTSATEPMAWSTEGKPAVGIVGLDEKSDVVLEKTTITFDIQEYPESDIDYIEGNFTPDNSRVSMKYDLYNPNDEEITVRLALPFTTTYHDYIKAEIEDYSVSVNGEEIEPDIRHSYHYKNYYFDMEYDPERLQDDYLTHAFVTPETKVTKYTYEIECADLKDNGIACVGIDIYGYKSAYIYMVGGSAMNLTSGSGYRLYRSIGKNTTVELYVISDQDIYIPGWTIYKNPKVSKDETLDGSVNLVKKEQMTWNDFVFAKYDESLGICEIDWYNAYMHCIDHDSVERPTSSFFNYRNDSDMTNWFMGWYRWDIVLAPGERASTEATLPIHPEIEFRYNPQKLVYQLDLPSPFVWWAGGEKEIKVNTPLYLLETSIGEYTKTDEGYSITPSSGQYQYRYNFTLCESESPELEGNKSELTELLESNSVLNIIFNIIVFPFKLIYMIIYRIVEWLR